MYKVSLVVWDLGWVDCSSILSGQYAVGSCCNDLSAQGTLQIWVNLTQVSDHLSHPVLLLTKTLNMTRKRKRTKRSTNALLYPCIDTAFHHKYDAVTLSFHWRQRAVTAKWHALGPSSLQMQGVLPGAAVVIVSCCITLSIVPQRDCNAGLQQCPRLHRPQCPSPEDATTLHRSLAWRAMQPCLCSGSPRCVCVTPKMRPAAKRAPREKVTRRNLPTEGSESPLGINLFLTQTSVGHAHIMMTMQVPSVDVKLNILVLCKS